MEKWRDMGRGGPGRLPSWGGRNRESRCQTLRKPGEDQGGCYLPNIGRNQQNQSATNPISPDFIFQPKSVNCQLGICKTESATNSDRSRLHPTLKLNTVIRQSANPASVQSQFSASFKFESGYLTATEVVTEKLKI